MGLLPPLTFACREVVVSAALEPAYQVAGDSVDYAVDYGVARVAMFDGMGHGLHGAQLASVAVAGYRNARRAGLSLLAATSAIDDAVTAAFGGESFTTAILGELDTSSGLLSWVNVATPNPLLLRQNRMIKPLRVAPGLPLGLDLAHVPTRDDGGQLIDAAGSSAPYHVAVEALEPGDRVLFYSDGIIEARSPSGQPLGVTRLINLLHRNLVDDLPIPEGLRRLMRELLLHQQGQLTDDATLLLLEWRGGTQGP